MRRNKKNSQGKLFFIFILCFAFFTKEAGDAASIPLLGQTETAFSTPQIQTATGTPLISQVSTEPAGTGLKNEFQWTEINRPEKQIYTQAYRFNWYRRKILSEKTFSIYNNIVTIIGNIIKSVNLFKEKISEVDTLNREFQKNIETKITSFNQNLHSFSEVGNILIN